MREETVRKPPPGKGCHKKMRQTMAAPRVVPKAKDGGRRETVREQIDPTEYTSRRDLRSITTNVIH